MKKETKQSKKRIVKDYENLSPELMELLHAAYPDGFAGATISFFDRDGKRVSAIPFETDEIYYLVRMVEKKAKPPKDDDDLDADLADVAGGDDDILGDGDSEEESSGDVSLDDIESTESSFTEDENY
jgi:DNA-directed RNA polymerase subunit delta